MEECHGMMLWMHSDRSKRICVPPLLFCLVRLNWPLVITIGGHSLLISVSPSNYPSPHLFPVCLFLGEFGYAHWYLETISGSILWVCYSRRCLGTICRYTDWTKGAHMQSKCLNPWPHWPLFWSSEISYYSDLPIRQATSLFALSFLLSMGR